MLQHCAADGAGAGGGCKPCHVVWRQIGNNSEGKVNGGMHTEWKAP